MGNNQRNRRYTDRQTNMKIYLITLLVIVFFIGLSSATLNITVNQTFANPTYETEQVDFTINVTYNTTLFPNATALFFYNNSWHNTTKSGNIFNVSLFAPLTENETYIPFYWNITFNSTESYNTSFINPTVYPIYFIRCNSTITRPYINFTFKDESTLGYINSSISASTFRYYLGDGSLYRTYSFSNSTNIS